MIDWELTARLAAIVAAGVASLLLVAFAAMVHSLHRLRAQAAREGDHWRTQVDRIGGDLAQLAAANLALREYLTALSAQVQATHQVTPPPAPAAGRAYDLAARLAAGGAASGDLVANCGLTPAEAELAVLVHGGRTRAATDRQSAAAPSRGGRRP